MSTWVATNDKIVIVSEDYMYFEYNIRIYTYLIIRRSVSVDVESLTMTSSIIQTLIIKLKEEDGDKDVLFFSEPK